MVCRLQTRSLVVHGISRAETRTLVRRFEHVAGFVVDGIVAMDLRSVPYRASRRSQELSRRIARGAVLACPISRTPDARSDAFRPLHCGPSRALHNTTRSRRSRSSPATAARPGREAPPNRIGVRVHQRVGDLSCQNGARIRRYGRSGAVSSVDAATPEGIRSDRGNKRPHSRAATTHTTADRPLLDSDQMERADTERPRRASRGREDQPCSTCPGRRRRARSSGDERRIRGAPAPPRPDSPP